MLYDFGQCFCQPSEHVKNIYGYIHTQIRCRPLTKCVPRCLLQQTVVSLWQAVGSWRSWGGWSGPGIMGQQPTHTIKLVCTWHSLHLPQTCASRWFNFLSSSAVSLFTAPCWPLHSPFIEKRRQRERLQIHYTLLTIYTVPQNTEKAGKVAFYFSLLFWQNV